MIDGYPLQWPEGFPRTRYPQKSRFEQSTRRENLTVHRAERQVYREIRLLVAKRHNEELRDHECIISTNLRRRKSDGGIQASQREPEDSGAAVYFMFNGKMRSIACDKWMTVRENLRAIALTVEAMRGMDRWGASEVLNRMFTGFAALPAPAVSETWREVFQMDGPFSLEPGERLIDRVRREYRRLMMKAHPDRGGSEEEVVRLQRALEEAERELLERSR